MMKVDLEFTNRELAQIIVLLDDYAMDLEDSAYGNEGRSEAALLDKLAIAIGSAMRSSGRL